MGESHQDGGRETGLTLAAGINFDEKNLLSAYGVGLVCY